MIIWTGVGSRDLPQEEYDRLMEVSFCLSRSGWSLRTGGADGADEACEMGWQKAWLESSVSTRTKMFCEVYLPWRGFNGHTSPLYTSDPHPKALEIAQSIHPAWNRLTQGAKKLHARNVHQVLGMDMQTPSDVLVCWTKGGATIGGTRTAIILAEQNGIPVVNLGGIPYSMMSFHEICEEVKSIVNENRSRQKAAGHHIDERPACATYRSK